MHNRRELSYNAYLGPLTAILMPRLMVMSTWSMMVFWGASGAFGPGQDTCNEGYLCAYEVRYVRSDMYVYKSRIVNVCIIRTYTLELC